ncbi:MAG: hypothetical protein JEZ07_20260 [Phycisphaerae bacterium]|nr:hypothetical protein [Phycisphaerae bacterium]
MITTADEPPSRIGIAVGIAGSMGYAHADKNHIAVAIPIIRIASLG